MVSSETLSRVHHNYSATAANVKTAQQRVYHGGPGRDWVQECAQDLASGVFGRPPDWRLIYTPTDG